MLPPSLESVPRAWVLLGIGLVALFGECPGGSPPPPGSPAWSEVLAALEAEPPGWVLAWPPGEAPDLAAFPPSLTVSDALPISGGLGVAGGIAVVGPLGEPVPPGLQDARLESRRVFGEIEIRRFSAGPAGALWDLRAGLDRATVILEGGEAHMACDQPRPEGGWSCPGRPPWNHVGPVRIRVEGRDWPAVWAHPVQGRPLVIEIPLPEGGTGLEVELALSDDAARTPGGAPVMAAVSVSRDDEVLSRGELTRTNAPGAVGTTLVVPAGADRILRLRVTTPRDARRHLGLNARLWSGAPPGEAGP